MMKNSLIEEQDIYFKKMTYANFYDMLLNMVIRLKGISVFKNMHMLHKKKFYYIYAGIVREIKTRVFS